MPPAPPRPQASRRIRPAATAHQHALTTGFSRAFLVAAGIALVNLAITIAAIRVRRTDLTGAHHPVTTESAGQTPQIRSM
jgi:hypothetical protein